MSRFSFTKLQAMLLMPLALFTGSLAQTTIVEASPRADETIDHFDISTSPIPNPACAHTSYGVLFFARVDTTVNLNDNQVDLEGGLGLPGIEVQAKSSDPSVAAFHPEILTATALDGRIGRGAKFTLKTEEAGSATLTMTGLLHWAGNSVIFPPLQQPIKVVHCRFKVTITSISAGTIPNISETMVYNLTGEIGGDSNAALKGDAEVQWSPNNATGCFNTTQVVSNSGAKLEGSLSGDASTLTLHVNFDPTMLFSTVSFTCGPGGGSASAPIQFQPSPIAVTVKTTGGNVSQPVSLKLGDMNLTGTAIINVMPIDGK